MTDRHPMWKDMTPEEKGAILLDEYEGREVQRYSTVWEKWVPKTESQYMPQCRYRTKPEPVRETVTLYGQQRNGRMLWTHTRYPQDTHVFTYEIEDGEPVNGTLRRIGDEQN